MEDAIFLENVWEINCYNHEYICVCMLICVCMHIQCILLLSEWLTQDVHIFRVLVVSVKDVGEGTGGWRHLHIAVAPVPPLLLFHQRLSINMSCPVSLHTHTGARSSPPQMSINISKTTAHRVIMHIQIWS